LFGDVPWVRFDEVIAPDAPVAAAHATPGHDDSAETDDAAETEEDTEAEDGGPSEDLLRFARRARELGGSEVGLAVRARPRTGDTAVSVAVVTPHGEHHVRRLVVQTGANGRARCGLAAAAVVLETLAEVPPG
jgi:hypothetical protein